MTVLINKGSPSNPVQWEDLCLSSGQFLAAPIYDQINSIYASIPIYISVLDLNNTLIGGAKLFINESRKLPTFIRSLSMSGNIYGEYIIHPHLLDIKQEDICSILNKTINELTIKYKLHSLDVYGHFGTLPFYPYQWLTNKTDFKIGLIDLTQSIEVLWENMHSKHRNAIRKAEKDGVIISSNGSYDIFKQLVKDTYDRQTDIAGPTEAFLDSYYSVADAGHQIKIYTASYNSQITGTALIHIYGHYADYAFAGSNYLHNGANTLMQWQIIQDLKALGYQTYNLGEIADISEEYENEKYSTGISRFKKRLGCTLHSAYFGTKIIHPFKYQIWQILIKWRSRIS